MTHCHTILPPGHDRPVAAHITLTYEARLIRRKRLAASDGTDVMVDLPAVVSLDAGAGLVLEDGRIIEVRAALEPVLRIAGDLPRLAWHIGNRHTPCAFAADHLIILQDHVLEAMLRQLGAGITPSFAAFTPEGGAYGHGRTFGHDHSHGLSHVGG